MFGKKKQKDDAPPAEGEAPAADGEAAEGEAKKKMSGKKLVLFIILPAVLVLGAGGGAAFLLLGKGGGEAEQHAEANAGHAKAKAKGGHGGAAAGEPIPGANGTTITYGEDVTFVALPEMLVNIVGPDGRPAYLKLGHARRAGRRRRRCADRTRPARVRSVERLPRELHR